VKISRIINRLEEVLIAWLLAFMTLLTFVQVVLRYVFNTGWVWSLEATTYSFAALVLVGMSYGVRTQAHIAVDVVVRRLPTLPAAAVKVTAISICVVYALLMLYGSSIFVSSLYTLGNLARDVPAPKWLLTMTMPLGFILLTYRFLEAGWRLIREIVKGAHQEPQQQT
jgi:C4-dicarboxylate transporter DctQ subunit